MKSMITLVATSAAIAGASHAGLVAGDVAIVGFQASGSPTDSIAFAALANLSAGTVIYFTDNGWTGTGFRGVSGTDSDGNENLMKFTVGAGGLAAGTVVSSVSTNNNLGVWTLSGLVGTGTSSFQQLGLSSSGEQVTAFVSTTAANPMSSGFTALWNFDNTGTLENATSSSTGSLPTGLTAATSTLLTGGSNYAVFNFASFTGAADAATWRTRFATAANWITGSRTDSMADGTFTIPAPGAIALLGAAGLVSTRRRR
jgi:hypothetical protein